MSNSEYQKAVEADEGRRRQRIERDLALERRIQAANEVPFRAYIAALEQERDRLAAELASSQGREVGLEEALSRLVHAIDELSANSTGVAGLHLNGDLAPWDELMPGGRFEQWLSCLGLADQVLRSPSPAARAIARVLEAVAIEYESPHLQSHLCEECEADPVVMEAVRAHDETMAAYAALQDLRSGQPTEDHPPASPAESETKP